MAINGDSPVRMILVVEEQDGRGSGVGSKLNRLRTVTDDLHLGGCGIDTIVRRGCG